MHKQWLQNGCLVYLTANAEIKTTIITPAPNMRFMDILVETSVDGIMRGLRVTSSICVAPSLFSFQGSDLVHAHYETHK